ncbi:hypothetical protein Pint_31669 [Pistacia integerrima]|uniref:Uncharacterized protein n=1 Tax=Pistacia integerrima TaxID=434235 RepID=A0ACC0XL64_9ROSI|nr:hypothetical protein Pint_31669 [Pistacia integerrima]
MHLMLKSVKGGDGAMSSNNNEPVLKLLTEDRRLLASRVDAVADAFLSRKGKQKSCWNNIMTGSELGLTPNNEARNCFGPVFPNLELPEGPSSYNDMDEEEAMSLEEDATLLASRLISGKGSRGVISITGGTGTGKTTLALKVYKHAAVAQNFPARAWVTLPREFEVKDILETIAKQLTAEFEEVKRGWTEEELMKRIYCFLRNKSEEVDPVVDSRRTGATTDGKPNGRIKTCRMHYLLRGQWESKAEEANFVNSPSEAVSSTPSSSSNSATIRRLADHLDSGDESFVHILGDTSTNYSLRSCYTDLRSILSFDSREGPGPGDEIAKFLQRGIAGSLFIRLRVIDLEGVFRPKLPKEIGKLVELREKDEKQEKEKS